jgi:hypothetical protein
MEERDCCPDQILLCVLLALACLLESRFTCAHGDQHFLFGIREEETNEPKKKAKGAYRYTLDKVWKDEDFIDLLQQVRGKVGTHSLRKFPATWASEQHGATNPEIEIQGHWKGSKNGRIVNRYISVEQLTTDAKVAGILCVWACQMCCKDRIKCYKGISC